MSGEPSQEHDNEEGTSEPATKVPKMGKRSFSIELKQQIVEFATKNSVNAAANHFKVDRQNIRKLHEKRFFNSMNKEKQSRNV